MSPPGDVGMRDFMKQGFDNLEKRIEASDVNSNRRFDDLTGRVDHVGREIAEVAAKAGEHEGKIALLITENATLRKSVHDNIAPSIITIQKDQMLSMRDIERIDRELDGLKQRAEASAAAVIAEDAKSISRYDLKFYVQVLIWGGGGVYLLGHLMGVFK